MFFETSAFQALFTCLVIVRQITARLFCQERCLSFQRKMQRKEVDSPFPEIRWKQNLPKQNKCFGFPLCPWRTTPANPLNKYCHDWAPHQRLNHEQFNIVCASCLLYFSISGCSLSPIWLNAHFKLLNILNNLKWLLRVVGWQRCFSANTDYFWDLLCVQYGRRCVSS